MHKNRDNHFVKYYRQFLGTKIHYMIEGESHSIEYESSQPHLMKRGSVMRH